jgi:hypothetical protein
MGQRVQPPERTLFYKSMLLCILAALLTDWALGRVPAGAARRGARALVLGAGVVAGASQVAVLARHNQQQVRQWQRYRQPMAWLARQPVGPVLAPAPAHRFLLRFFAHTEFRNQGWQIDDHPQPGVHYRYLVGQPGARVVPGGPPVGGRPAFHGLADIFVAP